MDRWPEWLRELVVLIVKWLLGRIDGPSDSWKEQDVGH